MDTTTQDIRHATYSELEERLELVRLSPKDRGTIELIVRRPRVDEREILDEAQLSEADGLVGDWWSDTKSSDAEEAGIRALCQVTLMNARALDMIAGSRERWAIAGDQIIVDFDLSEDNVPAGTRLALGDAVLEVTPKPHLGCGKFTARFGSEATKFFNSPVGREMHLRGIHARVVKAGVVRHGDEVTRLS